MNRKAFLRKSFVLCGAAVAGSVLLDACSKNSSSVPAGTGNNFTLDLTASSNVALNTVGGYILHGSVIVIRTGATSYAALSDICTHQGCTVGYNKNTHTLICPCHGGTYSISGAVISGPPPAPLTKYTTSLSGNTLTITT